MMRMSYTKRLHPGQLDYHEANPDDPFFSTPGYRKLLAKTNKYRMTVRQWETMLHSQNASCAGCETRFTPDGIRVDHCHETGLVRGLLCHSCNITLGWARDNPKTLRRLSEYLLSAVGPKPANERGR